MIGPSGDIQNSLSLYNVHFFMFMGWDGGIISTMLHMVKSYRGQNRGCACRCSYLSEIWFASSFENKIFFEICLEFFEVFELNVSV